MPCPTPLPKLSMTVVRTPAGVMRITEWLPSPAAKTLPMESAPSESGDASGGRFASLVMVRSGAIRNRLLLCRPDTNTSPAALTARAWGLFRMSVAGLPVASMISVTTPAGVTRSTLSETAPAT